MDARALVERIAGGDRYQDLTRPARSLARNYHYRIWRPDGPVLLKVYGTPARERRESHAIEALSGIDGIPSKIDGDASGELPWALFEDPGQWNLASLSGNFNAARRAGEILKAVHDSDPSKLSNLTAGIDAEWIKVDYASTMRRLERYRRRVGIDPDLYATIAAMPPPRASETTGVHTDPTPAHFAIAEDGGVTLVDWEWATLAPPEWDLSKASWLLRKRSGSAAAAALQEGYGRGLDPTQLDRWTVYHAAMLLVYEAEQQMSDTGIDSYSDTVDDLRRIAESAPS
jgi:hypothetical protein